MTHKRLEEVESKGCCSCPGLRQREPAQEGRRKRKEDTRGDLSPQAQEVETGEQFSLVMLQPFCCSLLMLFPPLWLFFPFSKGASPYHVHLATFSFCLIFHLSSHSLHCSAPEFVWFFFMISLLNLLLCTCTSSMISLSFLSVCSYTSLSFLKTITQNSLSSNSHISISLGSVTVKLLCCLVESGFLDCSCPLKPCIGVCLPI